MVLDIVRSDVSVPVFVHPTADVSADATIGPGTRVWRHTHVREGARIGAECILGKGVYIDHDVVIGDRVKVENGASIFYGCTIEAGVFVGPHACLTNDRQPRAITPLGALKTEADWQVGQTLVQYGASIGAGAVIVTGVTIGRWAMVGAGAVVTRNVPDHGLVLGLPARLIGYVCSCGVRLTSTTDRTWCCSTCGSTFRLPPIQVHDHCT